MKDVHDLEIYAPINDFPDYLITSHGRILSLKKNKIYERKLTKDKDGYLLVNLWKNNKMEMKKVHRLVAQTFITNPENKPQVNHIDENKTNNHVSNLEWVTCKENINHGNHNKNLSKTKSKKIMAKSLTHNKVLIFKSYKSAKMFGFDLKGTWDCCNGKRKQYKGYVWNKIDKDTH